MESRRTQIEGIARHFDDLSGEYDAYADRRISYIERVDEIVIDTIEAFGPCNYLDVGCGTGRLLKKLGTRLPESAGHGVDVSPRMVELCRSAGLSVTRADFIDYQPDSTFDVVVLEFNVFGYLVSQNGLMPALDHIRKLLSDRGCAVFDILNPYCLTYASLLSTVPRTLARWFQLRQHGGVYYFEYAVKENPVTMGIVDRELVSAYFRDLGYSVDVHLVEYAPHVFSGLLPEMLTSQVVFVVRSQ